MDEGTDRIILFSYAVADIAKGFLMEGDSIVKYVFKADLEDPYAARPMARYQGLDVNVFGQDAEKGTVCLTTEDREIGERLGFSRDDKDQWRKWVLFSELERTWERRRPLNL